MKLADNLSRHNISHVFKIWPEWTIYFGVTCLKRPYLTFWACWTRVSDRCPLGDLFCQFPDLPREMCGKRCFVSFQTCHWKCVVNVVLSISRLAQGNVW